MQNQTFMPSPARVGFSGAPQSPATSAVGAQAPTSSTHLKIADRSTPLATLPPHRRAQCLLQELAGLCTRLFEVSSNKASWLAAYRGSLPSFLPGSCICPEAASATTPKEILSIAESHQNILEETITELLEIQKLEQEKKLIAEEMKSKDSAVHAFAKKLREAQQILEQTLEDYEDYRKNKRLKTSDSFSENNTPAFTELDLSSILSYAHKISYSTFAPPEFGADQGPLRGAIPPAPQEEQMRASLLYQFADLDVGIPKQPTTDALPAAIIEPPPETVTTKAAQDAVPGFVVPPIPPPGWMPGMPVEVPAMPPGWKPGDPVPLPQSMEVPAGWKPGDAVVLPKPEEAVQPPPKPAALPRAQEPIQVKYVELDINPESPDDYSSEYTSEEGSSDDGE
eukprot:TRINITY_DN3378_c0_g1_i1.p1 TRINITY_DN3378_c0_g1~~TRINITY_DN3378_c0_g1_i1.p1  ORF type:complete len:396 (-),score=90.36 TRINITY_DN3378_c0_g1_i1:183-1370(-)